MADAQNQPDWESLYDQLLARQKAVADREFKQTDGSLSEAELGALQAEIRQVQLLSDVVYERAFQLVALRVRSSGAPTHNRSTMTTRTSKAIAQVRSQGG